VWLAHLLNHLVGAGEQRRGTSLEHKVPEAEMLLALGRTNSDSFLPLSTG
jgi:hypothetical protein